MSTTTLTKFKTYNIDPGHSAVRFWVRHLMVAKVHGSIDEVTGTVRIPENIEESQIDVTIEVASLSTQNEMRDGHLKSADFLDTENSPQITFRSTRIRALGGDDYEVFGDLTIRGITREVVLKAEVSQEIVSPFGGYKRGVSASLVVNREDFGMTWNQALETGGVMVGKEINIQIDAELDLVE